MFFLSLNQKYEDTENSTTGTSSILLEWQANRLKVWTNQHKLFPRCLFVGNKFRWLCLDHLKTSMYENKIQTDELLGEICIAQMPEYENQAISLNNWIRR